MRKFKLTFANYQNYFENDNYFEDDKEAVEYLISENLIAPNKDHLKSIMED